MNKKILYFLLYSSLLAIDIIVLMKLDANIYPIIKIFLYCLIYVFPYRFFTAIKSNYSIELSFVVCIAILIYLLFLDKKATIEEIHKYGGTIQSAVIYKKTSSRKNSCCLYIYYIPHNGIINEFDFQSCDDYDYKNVGDSILVVYSNYSNEKYLIYDLYPTPAMIQMCKDGWPYEQREQLRRQNVFINEESSSDKLEGVTDKEIEDEILDADFAIVYTKGINSVWPKYFVKLKYNNTVSDYIGIDDIYKKQIYESLNEGDTVIIQKPKSNSEKIQVLSWEPTPEEIEKYRTPVRGTENN